MAVGDDTLVRQAAAGSTRAGEELFARHWPRAWKVAYSLTGSAAAADDVAADAFERAFRALGQFNGRSSFGTWLTRIVVNRAIDVARHERATEPLEDAAAGATLTSLDVDGHRRDVVDAVHALPLERRTVVVLRYWARFSAPEIAEILGVPLGTVHSRLARSLDALRSRLEVRDVSST